MIIGLTNIILYLNLISIGYTFSEYISFILKRIECLIYILGLTITFIIFRKKGEKHDIHL